MKKLVRNGFLIGTLLLPISLTACSNKVIEKPYVVTKYTELAICERPTPIEYKQYNSEYHVGHKVNQEITDYNLIITVAYIKNLSNTIECYEVQTKKGIDNETANTKNN